MSYDYFIVAFVCRKNYNKKNDFHLEKQENKGESYASKTIISASSICMCKRKR